MTEDREVRTRVAPSPTGDPHIGTVYQALFDYVFAKRHGGKFILRIEDTDQTRSTRESEQAILDALRWAGIPYDEGPDVGGPHGPYRQSERTAIYREHCRTLVEKGGAYPCFCTPERLEELRRRQTAEKAPLGYDGLCASLGDDEARRRIEAGEAHVIRLKVPREGECVMRDRLRGEIRIPWANVDHQVLLKSDGFPTYHLAVVVDDHLMRISHVIRGEEWINSTPKHLLLYEHFGWAPPEFIHLPLLRNPDKSKLSKRKNPTSVNYYRQAGILPEALLNYLGLMAYTLPDGREIFSAGEMAETFDIGRVSLGGPIFDLKKLAWLNGRYLREKHDPEALLQRLKDWKLNDETWRKIIPLAQKRIEKMADIVPMAAYLFADELEYDPQLLIGKETGAEVVAGLLKIAQWELEKARTWDVASLEAVFNRMSEKENLRLRDLTAPFYVAIAGSPVALPLFDSMAILGSDMTRRRLQRAVEALGKAGFELKGKALKELEKRYAQMYMSRPE